jgi:Pyridoxamine 5'-phosphate oxidase
MGKVFERVDPTLAAWLQAQPVFFVATAPSDLDGHINLSPKGVEGTFAVLDEHRVAYLDLTGSGIETVAHLGDNNRIVLMFCAFSGPPRIVRLHGRGRAVLARDPAFDAAVAPFPGPVPTGARSVIEVDLTRISDSCGFGVPLMDLVGQRPLLPKWASGKGSEGITEYQATRNRASVDGLPGVPVS